MRGRFYDGVTGDAQSVEARLEGEALIFPAGGADRRWTIAGLRMETLGELTRLAPAEGDERLLLATADWRAAAGGLPARLARRGRGREAWLIAGLAAAGLAVIGFVFFGMPVLSRPLAFATPPALERQMGDSFEAQLTLGMRACGGGEGQRALQALGARLEQAAETPFQIRVRAVQAPFANAFALPGGAVLVTDDLIAMTHDPNELSAVIAHEVAHVEKRHVMQAVWRSLGLGLVLDAVVGGGSGAGQQAVLLAGGIADLRYSRDSESEADARGMALLQAAGLSSQGMAPFFERLAAKGQGADAAAVKELISSHPDSLRRARLSRASARPGAAPFSAATWAAVKAACAKDAARKR